MAPELAALALDFPGWHLWQSRSGEYWAVRREDTAAPQEPGGCCKFARGATLEELRAELSVQERLAGHAR